MAFIFIQKDYATYFKESRISRSNLSTEKKAAAMVSFDECLAVDFTPPHHIFAFELEKIQGSFRSNVGKCISVNMI